MWLELDFVQMYLDEFWLFGFLNHLSCILLIDFLAIPFLYTWYYSASLHGNTRYPATKWVIPRKITKTFPNCLNFNSIFTTCNITGSTISKMNIVGDTSLRWFVSTFKRRKNLNVWNHPVRVYWLHPSFWCRLAVGKRYAIIITEWCMLCI